MTESIILLIVCIVLFVISIPLFGLLGGALGYLLSDNEGVGALCGFIGYIFGVVVWATAIVCGIIQVINLVNGT